MGASSFFLWMTVLQAEATPKGTVRGVELKETDGVEGKENAVVTMTGGEEPVLTGTDTAKLAAVSEDEESSAGSMSE